jgi:hypothetical protein
MAGGLVLERSLARSSAPTVDVTVLVGCGDYGGGVLRGEPLPHRLPESWFCHPTWRLARRVAERAGRRDDEWVLLEFDDAQMDREIPLPHVFVTPGETGRGWRKPGPQVRALLDGVSRERQELLRHCVVEIPEPHGPCLIGRMLARRDQGIRLLVPFARLETLIEYLRAVGWKPPQSACRAWEVLGTTARIYLLNLEIGAGVEDRVGIETYFHPPAEPGAPSEWEAFLEGLVARGLCRLEERRDLLLTIRGEGTPLRSLPFVAHRAVSTKLVIDRDGLSVKAYLSLDYHPKPSFRARVAQRCIAC